MTVQTTCETLVVKEDVKTSAWTMNQNWKLQNKTWSKEKKKIGGIFKRKKCNFWEDIKIHGHVADFF